MNTNSDIGQTSNNNSPSSTSRDCNAESTSSCCHTCSKMLDNELDESNKKGKGKANENENDYSDVHFHRNSGFFHEINEDNWFLQPRTQSETDHIQERIELRMLNHLSEKLHKVHKNKSKLFDLDDISPFLVDGIEALIEDEFTNCFLTPCPKSWNWNIYLFFGWILGIFIRFCILFPLRLIFLLSSIFVFSILFLFTFFIKNKDHMYEWQRKLIKFLSTCLIVSWSGVIRYHGTKPIHQENQIFVCNHTTVLDIVILMQNGLFGIVGQEHPGIMGFCQKYLLESLGCMWFERMQRMQRMDVANEIKAYIRSKKNLPLLIFPEGVCVNNNYCIMFKKGAFELGAQICPIAMKYNLDFCDAYFNSREQSFIMHLFRVMTSWAVVCDVWYLPTQIIKAEENSLQFANRIKGLIAKKAGLINVPWDGYMKYFKPGRQFLERRQRIFASVVNVLVKSQSAPSGLSKIGLHSESQVEQQVDSEIQDYDMQNRESFTNISLHDKNV